MGGKVSLPLTVELSATDGPMDLAPTWTDISSYVQRAKTISLSRGSSPETLEPEPGRGQLRIRNKNGEFTPGETSSVLGGATIRNRMPIRARSGSTVLWTGLVDKWTMGYDNGRLPIVDATLVDRWARLKARTITGERIAQVCQAIDCADLWPLDDPAGSTRGVSLTSGWALRSLYGNPPGWGETTPDPHTDATGMLPVLHMPTGGAWVRSVWDDVGEVTPAIYDAFTVSLWVRCPLSDSSAVWHIDEDSDPGIKVNVFQSLIQMEADPLSIAPGSVAVTTSAGWRHIVATADFTGAAPVVALWLDGTQIWTDTAPPGTWTPMRLHTLTGDNADLAYAATWPRVLSSAEIQAVTAAGTNALGQTGQTGDVRAGLIAEMWAPTTLTVQGADWSATMSKQTVEGVSQADLLLQCATAEAGRIHMGTDGWPVLQSKGVRSAGQLVSLTVADYDTTLPYDLPLPYDGGTTGAAIPATVLASDATWELDDAQVVNSVQVDRMAIGETASTVNRRNKASIDAYGEVSKTVQVWLDSDVQAVDRANAEAQLWADPTCRSRSFAVDLFTCQAEVTATELLTVDIGGRIVISDLPDTAPTQTAAGWYVDAIADEITEKSWKRTFTVTPAIDYLVIDDSVFGGLDEWPIG